MYACYLLRTNHKDAKAIHTQHTRIQDSIAHIEYEMHIMTMDRIYCFTSLSLYPFHGNSLCVWFRTGVMEIFTDFKSFVMCTNITGIAVCKNLHVLGECMWVGVCAPFNLYLSVCVCVSVWVCVYLWISSVIHTFAIQCYSIATGIQRRSRSSVSNANTFIYSWKDSVYHNWNGRFAGKSAYFLCIIPRMHSQLNSYIWLSYGSYISRRTHTYT